MKLDRVDILIPVHNAVATFAEAIDSLRAQSHEHVRIIVVDDGSTDASPELIEAYRRLDTRICVLTTPKRGIVAALNLGLCHCDAEFVARFDADDIACEHRIELQLRYLREHLDCVAVGGQIEHIGARGELIEGLPRPGDPCAADPSWFPAREPYIVHPFLMARRSALVAVGGYRHVHNSEDSDLYWRLAERGRLHNLSDKVGKYRLGTSTISSASIVNGRIMAIFSQLGAISALRRRSGCRDLVFSNDASEFRKAASFARMYELACAQLTAYEAQRLRLAASIKLLELAAYRPYELAYADCAFIRTALAQSHIASRDNRRHIEWHISRAGARLLRQNNWREAFELAPARQLPAAFARAVLKQPISEP